MGLVDLTCSACGKDFQKQKGEYRRRIALGSKRFFCSIKCASAVIPSELNALRVSTVFSMRCKCGKVFETSTKVKSKRHCSNECASRFSVNDARRKAAVSMGKANGKHLSISHAGMLKREGWKYALIQKMLEEAGVEHVFEERIGDSGPLFDMLLPAAKTVVEFDGPYHKDATQRELDRRRTEHASALGWRVIRVDTPPNCVIDPCLLTDVLGAELVSTSAKKVDCVARDPMTAQP